MKFLLDENISNSYKEELIKCGYSDIKRINDFGKGLPDNKVYNIAYNEKRILLTIDHDFYEYKKQENMGIISLSYKLKNPIEKLDEVFKRIEKNDNIPNDYHNVFLRMTNEGFKILYKKKKKYKERFFKYKK